MQEEKKILVEDCKSVPDNKRGRSSLERKIAQGRRLGAVADRSQRGKE